MSAINVHPSETTSFRAAYEAMAARRAALRPTELMPINLDIPSAIATAIGAIPGIQSLRETIKTSLPTIEMDEVDAIMTYAEALSYAHTAYLAVSKPSELPALLKRANQVRDQLLSDASALARRNFLDAKRLAELKGGTGYLAVAYDVGVLVRMLRERWTDITGKSAIQASELDEAEALYEQVTRAHGERTQQSAGASIAADERVRAYTLLVKAYDQVRRAATFVRWGEDDADKFVPSLWAGRGGRGSADKADEKPAEKPSDPPPKPDDQEVVPGGEPGAWLRLDGSGTGSRLELPARHRA